MTLQVMYQGIVFSSYFANKAYIAAVLCENKDKPQLECEGKCYLKKQLQKADTPESNATGLTLKLEISPFTASLFKLDKMVAVSPVQTGYGTFQESSYRNSYRPACFHPPQV
ncbi:hypothetical protein K3G39_05755 [Pontibacter sp. HSC-14F20]|uniref:hypothetical protein n=1 Tax=Pontibacter sp. HSC-14F20 TaxID=2864136 RepID=UPI001C734913|nr:hypothetical protein [Pontibacter sp. HSC-14F20]MBX0332736.1 hypothetical protein [Pontibacter sp. HSC-14F20]